MSSDKIEGVTSNGLVLKTYTELLEDFQEAMNKIYAKDGNLINFDSSTPDGQLTNIVAQMGSDIRDFATMVYNSFNPDNCQGVVQDTRYAINYLTRKAGIFTTQEIDVTCDRTVTLTGLDAEASNPQAVGGFIVSDGSSDGVWYLRNTVTLVAGTHRLPFRSKNYGAYQPAIGTINTMVTIIPGVISVTNALAPITLGEEQETDSEFKIRRSKSTVRPAQNNLDALYAEIMNMDSVKDCMIWVNNTDTIDETGTNPYTVWVIVEGGNRADINKAIYQYSCGLATRGAVSDNNYSIAGQLFVTSHDEAVGVPLYIKFDYQTTEYVAGSLLDSLKDEIARTLTFTLNEDADVNKVNFIAYEANMAVSYNLGTILNLQISTDGTNYTDFIKSASLQNKFLVDSTRIDITNTLESTT